MNSDDLVLDFDCSCEGNPDWDGWCIACGKPKPEATVSDRLDKCSYSELLDACTEQVHDMNREAMLAFLRGGSMNEYDLRMLVKRWAVGVDASDAEQMERCADELDAVLNRRRP